MPLVIPVFIPHQGCPQQCLFCNQHAITGVRGGTDKAATLVATTIRQWLARSLPASPAQLAFFGGSFTCLPRARQEELLAAVQPFLSSGEVGCIRLSTRPDCVDAEVCAFLYARGVRIVELGVQSLDDRVLLASRRGHDAQQSRQAVTLLQAAGIEVGVQLMPGLPQESTGSFFQTVRGVIALAPSFVRLYPALVVEQAELAALYRRGEYRPLSMNKAVALCCRARELLVAAGIRVVRIGLQPTPALEQELLAGPYHPAFGELVAARMWFNKIRALLAACPAGRHVVIRIAQRDLSAVVGMKRMNMLRFERLGLADRLEIRVETNRERGSLEYAVN